MLLAHHVAGFSLNLPDGFELELARTHAVFSLQARRPAPGEPRIQIDGIEMIDPQLSLDKWIAVDDATYSRRGKNKYKKRRRRVAGRAAVQVERQFESASDELYETVVYVNSGTFLITVRVAGSLDQIRLAADDLEAVLASISISK